MLAIKHDHSFSMLESHNRPQFSASKGYIDIDTVIR